MLRPSGNSSASENGGTTGGALIPLHAVAEINVVDGPAQVSREFAKRRVVVGANVHERDLGGFVEEIQEIIVINEYASIKLNQNHTKRKSFYNDSNGAVMFELPKNDHNQAYIASSPSEEIIRLSKIDKKNNYIGHLPQENIYVNLKGEKVINQTSKHFSGNFKNGLAINCIEKEGILYHGYIDTKGIQKMAILFPLIKDKLN